MKLINDYSIHELITQDNKFSTYRGIRNSDHKKLILKLCHLDNPTIEEHTTLQHEYQILILLDSVQVIHAQELIKNDDQYILILEHSDGITLKEYLKNQPLSLTRFFQIALELIDTVNMIHMHHIIHKNINPNSILINPQTGIIKLMDFSIASQLAQEMHDSFHLGSLEGKLFYISPEQTGRMNRPIDYRSDFYSLGITFYEMLTGTLPFQSDDPLEMIHHHLAIIPDSVTEINGQIPQQVAAIIAKMLAKTPEERYISESGLKADIIECQKQWENKHQIDSFPLGQQDSYDYLILSQKLYGRDHEIKKLFATFDRVKEGSKEVLFISGYSGIGKSSLVKELYKPVTPEHGYLIKGKYDQLERTTPYSAIIEAFKELTARLASEPEEQLHHLKQTLLAALGNNGKIITDVIPDVALIIGPQPDVVALSPNEAQNRFRLTLQGFIRSLAKAEHPLVVFLDDLQWVDSASLQLIESLLQDPELGFFLLIGAYRDNEVSTEHPLTLFISRIQKNGIQFEDISLPSLKKVDIQQMLADSFNCDISNVATFASLLLEKTHGNPFFINQFLKILYQKKMLTYLYEQRQWAWDLSNIHLDTISEDIIDLLTYRIKQLPEDTQQLLTLAACIGHTFDLQTLALISEHSIDTTMQKLASAVTLNLILPVERGYKVAALIKTISESEIKGLPIRYHFLHDRIQQAAYSMIPDDIKEQVHYKIGKLLLERRFLHENDETLFDIVNHFILSLSLINDHNERKKIAQYCYWAGKKAKASTAYQAAKKYLHAGVSLLQPIHGNAPHNLLFMLNREFAVCLYLTGEFELAENNFHQLIKQAQSITDKIECYKLYCEMLATLNKHAEALRQGITALSLVGIRLPAKPNLFNILSAIFKIRLKLGWRNAGKITLNPIKNHQHQATIDLISQMLNSAFILDQNLFIILTCTNVQLSLSHGYADSTGFACVAYAFIILHALNRYKEAMEFVELQNNLSEWNLTPNFAGKNSFVLGCFIDPYRYPVKTSLESIAKAYHFSYEVGDLAYSNYSNILLIILSLMSGSPLSAVEKHIRTALSFIDRIKTNDFRTLTFFYYYSLQCLSSIELSEEQIDSYEEDILKGLNKTEKCFFYSHCTQLFYIMGNFAKAREYGNKHRNIANYALGIVSVMTAYFYHALSITNSAKRMSELDGSEISIIKKTLQYLYRLTTWCRVNFERYYLLLKAEIDRLENNPMRAIQMYNQSISSAAEQNAVDIQAIANECASRFFRESGFDEMARVHLKNAHRHYQKMQAFSKCLLLEKQFPDYFQHDLIPLFDKLELSKTMDIESIDALSILKSTQAFTSEIQLESLLNKLIHILIENAGAQRGILIARKNDNWQVEAEGTISEQKTYLDNQCFIEKYKDVPLSLINRVAREKEIILTQNSHELNPYLDEDNYLDKFRPQSILVLPIHFQGQLRYILYLENRSTSHAFTPKHVTMLRLLASQAAISLENAYLYYQASHDPLTGLANRNLLYKIFNQKTALASQQNKKIAILFMDIDNFKKTNDTLGHEVGDRILIYFSQILSSCTSTDDLAARLGGDEFILMLPNIEDNFQVINTITKLMQQLVKPVYIMNHEIYISTSIGISIYPNDSTEIHEILNQADLALYHVKSNGKNHYAFYHSDLSQKLKEDFALEIALRTAFEKKELYLSFQPIFSCRTRKLTRFEVLLRWQHPAKGLIHAKDFIPLAEKTGLIVPIGEWALKTVCMQIKAWESSGLPLVPTAVNVSGLQFQYQMINEVIGAIIQDTNIDPRYLELEFTESVFIAQTDKIRNDIAALKNLNIRLAIDDFGTYFSSLSYLKHLPIDTIKIDRSFVNDINQDNASNSLIRSIVSMAHHLKLSVTAEGVESEEQLRFLEDCGVDEVQGYYLGVPVDSEECTKLLKDNQKAGLLIE